MSSAGFSTERDRGSYAPTLNMGNITSIPKGFHLFPLCGCPLQSWLFMQGLVYSALGFSISINPQILDVFLSFFNDADRFYPADYELAQYFFSFVLIMGITCMVNGSDAFFNREIVPLVLKEMENLPHSHALMSSLNYSIVRLTAVPVIMILILLTFGKQKAMITCISVSVLLIEPLFGFVTLYIIRRYPQSDYPQYSAIILNINESDVEDSESTKLVTTS